jgi:enoyl-CoA hydratase/carnithine racemase
MADDSSGIARITLDNPSRKNATTRRCASSGCVLDELAYDDDTKVVVLAARAACSARAPT